MTRAARRRLPIPGNEHIEIETLAALAEGRADEATAEQAAAHLAVCRSCMAAYADAVRYQSAWLATPTAFAPRPAMLRRGRGVGPAAPRRRQAALVWRLAPAFAAAAIAAAGFAAWRMLPTESPALRAALERESSRGLVLPGGERGAGREAPVERGPVGGDAALEEAVKRASRMYEAGDRSSSMAYQVAAGFLLSGNLDAARDYLAEGMRAHPGDRRLEILAAALDYRNSDLAGAESKLREVLRGSPHDGVATLNLGIVLAERDAKDESRTLLESLIAREPGSPLAWRAGKIVRLP